MEDQVWSHGRLTSSSKYNHGANNSTSYDFYDDDYEEIEVDEDMEAEFICPFCSEEFDILGLCCHMEEAHPIESRKGICPICGELVGVNLIDHVALEHEYAQRRDGYDGRESNAISMLQKEMDDRSLESLLMRPPSSGVSLNVVADRLLTSFIGNYQTTTGLHTTSSSSEDFYQEEKALNENILERAMENLSVTDENKEEKAQKSKFVQSLLFSTMLDDDL